MPHKSKVFGMTTSVLVYFFVLLKDHYSKCQHKPKAFGMTTSALVGKREFTLLSVMDKNGQNLNDCNQVLFCIYMGNRYTFIMEFNFEKIKRIKFMTSQFKINLGRDLCLAYYCLS